MHKCVPTRIGLAHYEGVQSAVHNILYFLELYPDFK